MRRLLPAPALCALALCCAAAAEAQTQKLDARLLAQRAAAARARAGMGLAAAGAYDPMLGVLLRLRPGVAKSALAARYPQARFGALLGEVLTGELPESLLNALSGDADIVFADAAVTLKPALSLVRSTATASGIVLGVVDPAFPTFATDGAGVIVGVVDTGIDWAHQDFRLDSDPTQSRIRFLWDQTLSGTPPSGFSYGEEYTQSDINNEIDGSPAGAVLSRDTDGHGTHVAGIAAGDGSATDGAPAAGTYKGMAPGAELVFVKTDFSTTKILDGMNYIIQKAQALGRRAVINLSISGQDGPHDGSGSFDGTIGTIAQSTPVVIAAGNDHGLPIHAQTLVSSNHTFSFRRFGVASLLTVEFWYPGTEGYSVTVTVLGQAGSVTATNGNSNSGTINGTLIEVFNAQNSGHPLGHKQVFIQLTQGGGIVNTDFRFAFTKTTNGGNHQVDGWVFDTGVAQFDADTVQSGTGGSPGVAANAITVGSYCARRQWRDAQGVLHTDSFCDANSVGDISSFSGRGPTRDGRTKPDLAAPGHRVASSSSTYIQNDPELGINHADSDRHRYLLGTSMASPVVAGIVALKLAATPAATPAQLLASLQGIARSDAKVAASGSLPNSTWGYGKATARGCGDVVTAQPSVPAPTVASSTTISWAWNLVANATAYHVYYETAPAVIIATVTAPALALDGLLPNTTYGIRVRGASPCGQGPEQVSGSTSTLALPLAGASGLAVHVASITASFASLPASPREASSFGYRLDAALDPDFLTPVITSATLNPAVSNLTVSGLQGLATYYLRLAALAEGGAPNYVSIGSSLTKTTLGSPPLGLFDSVSAAGLRGVWSLGGNPAGLQYVANLSTAPDFSGAMLSSATFNLFAQYSSLSANATYYFRVRPTTGPFSAVASTPTWALAPGAASPAFASVFLTSATALWTDGGNPPGTRFWARASADPAFASGVSSSDTANASLPLTGLAQNTTIYLRVAALNHAGVESSFLSFGTSTLTDPPASPAFGSVTSSITVVWTAVASEGYRVEASTAANFSGTLIRAVVNDGAATQLGLENLVFETTYYLRVGALNWNSVANFVSVGSTKTNTQILSSAPVSGGELVLSVDPPFTQLERIEVRAPPGALPAGVSLTLNASVPFVFDPGRNTAGALTPLGDSVGVDISAQGEQPLFPVQVRMVYDPAALPAGRAPEDLVIANLRDGVWTLLPTEVDPQARSLTAQTLHFSLFAPFAASAAGGLDAVSVFPVPWKPGSGDRDFDAAKLTFANLPASARVRVYTILGERVFGGSAGANGILTWGGASDAGNRAGSGTYLAVIEAGGRKTVRRVVILR